MEAVVTSTGSRLVVKVGLVDLAVHLPCEPYNDPTWRGMTRPLTETEVAQAVMHTERLHGDQTYPRDMHAGRVAHLAATWANDGSDPIEIEVCAGVVCHDGYHRLAAAGYRRDEHIHIELSGMLDEAVELGLLPAGFEQSRASS